MKKLYLIIIMMFCAGDIMAQTYCEKVFANAAALFKDGKYNEAKQKFEAVKKDCPNNKDIAKIYIQLCEEKITNIALGEKVDQFNELQDSLKKTKDSLGNCQEELLRATKEKDTLQAKNNRLLKQNEKLTNIHQQEETANKQLKNLEQEKIEKLQELLNQIDRDLSKCENVSFMKRVFKHKETEKTISSIREKIGKVIGIKPEEE